MARSVRIHAFGGPEVLSIEEVNVPEPGAGEIRLRVRAIGINRTEVTLRSGRAPVKPALPTGLGFEAAGIVDAVGPGVTGIKLGDRVALVPAYGAAQYALYGELAIAPARSVVAIPEGTDFIEAAATWAAFGTAWGGLIATGGLAPGQTVLIPAASSSVGLAAIQIANRIGARTIALTRTSTKRQALLAQGAGEVIATAEEDVVAAVSRLTAGKGADLVFDPVAGAAFLCSRNPRPPAAWWCCMARWLRSPRCWRPSMSLPGTSPFAASPLSALVRSDARLAQLKDFVATGVADRSLRPVIDRTFTFDQIAAAHRFMEAGGQVGKIVVTV